MSNLDTSWIKAYKLIKRNGNKTVMFNEQDAITDTFYILSYKNDTLTRQISQHGHITTIDEGGAFAPIAAGSYGCVFFPRLLSLGEPAGTRRGKSLISKLMTIEAAQDEWEEQVAIKERLILSGVARDEDVRYIFGVSPGVQEVGNMTVDDMTKCGTICTNFDYKLTREMISSAKWRKKNVRKIDQPNGGLSVGSIIKQAVDKTDTFSKLMELYVRDDGLLDNISAMNAAGVYHNDIKSHNMTVSDDFSQISIIDWGLASITPSKLDDNAGDWQPMSTWQFNIPITNVFYLPQFISKFRNAGNMTTEFIWEVVTDLVMSEYEKGEAVDAHLTFCVSYVDLYRRMKRDWNPKYIDKVSNEQSNRIMNSGDYETSGRSIMYFCAVMVRRIINIIRSFKSMVTTYRRVDGVDKPGENYFNSVFKHNVDIWGAMTVIMDSIRKIDLTKLNADKYTELIGYVFIDGGDTTPYDLDKIKCLIRDVIGITQLEPGSPMYKPSGADIDF